MSPVNSDNSKTWPSNGSQEQIVNIESRKIPWVPPVVNESEIMEQRKIPWTTAAAEQQHMDTSEPQQSAWPTNMIGDHESTKSLHQYKSESQVYSHKFYVSPTTS